MKLKLGFVLTSLATAALLLAGCGKSETSAQSVAANDPKAAPDGREIVFTANDAMKYNLTEIHAQSGEKLRISLTNLGRMPKQAMAHNWVLLMPMSDADVTAFSMAAASHAPEYLPVDQSKVIAHTKFLGPSETDTIEFNAPSTPGDYPYLCSFPGHAALMRGKLIVSPAKP